MKKYTLDSTDTLHIGPKVLTRIRGAKGSEFEGMVGGYLENEQNLSHDGQAWVADLSRVWGEARVYGDAQIRGHAQIFGRAQVFGQSLVEGKAQVFGDAQVFGRARVCDYAQVGDFAWVCGFAEIQDYARVLENSQVFARAILCDTETLRGEERRDGGAKMRSLLGYRLPREILRRSRLSRIPG